jgi:hypothetical protein
MSQTSILITSVAAASLLAQVKTGISDLPVFEPGAVNVPAFQPETPPGGAVFSLKGANLGDVLLAGNANKRQRQRAKAQLEQTTCYLAPLAED